MTVPVAEEAAILEEGGSDLCPPSRTTRWRSEPAELGGERLELEGRKSLGACGAREPRGWAGETTISNTKPTFLHPVHTHWDNSRSVGGGTASPVPGSSTIRKHLSLMMDMTSPNSQGLAARLKKSLSGPGRAPD